MTNISKTYDPKAVETKWYRYWEDNNLFQASPNSGKKPYCILMPPPNITGELHMGHALQDTLQDMLIRLKRMQGFESHWQPGKDHAGIATQNVVEKTLAGKGITRQDLGRDKFVERVWDWKQRYGNRIFEQKKLLGDSADWTRERFTLDEGLSNAVAKVFVHLYEKGLIYRGKYIVNWCPRCRTAISDEEVDHKDHDHHLWYFRYPIKDSDEFVTVATTRPETMLGDTAVAVNPSDERFKDLWDKTIILPLVEREIPMIRDEFVDPEFGTGQVKVTPAHDQNDFEMGQRHNLPSVVVMDEDGVMNDNAGELFKGMDRFKARDAVVNAMRERGLLEKIEDYKTSIGHCQRCKTMIEPYQSLQWFVKMKPLAEPALKVVREGKIRFYPARWEKVYYSWMENIRDWCISRQLWWGHRIPVWYCQDCGEINVKTETPDQCKKCGSKNLKQDEDVLDTWFSSWLWPFSPFGWPEETDALKFWYPTDVMVTGYDIIFFWVARMVMAAMEFMDEIPFKTVYITGMIKDELGRWMSKSLGNGIDPAEMVEQYGGDAVRYTLITLATEGQDIKLTPSRFEGGRNFANKIWNSFRFLKSHIDRLNTKPVVSDPFNLSPDAPLSDRWIVSRLHAATEKVINNADKYRLNDSMMTMYDFTWKEYCDWYLEMIKVRLTPDTPEDVKRETLTLAVAIYETILRLLHPGMPFITEELWQELREYYPDNLPPQLEKDRAGQPFATSIMWAPFPKPQDFQADTDAESEMDFLQRIIGAIRNIRSEMRVPPDRKASVVLNECILKNRQTTEANIIDVKRLATLSDISFDKERPLQSASAVVNEVELFVPLADLIDIDIERERLDKEINRLQKLIKGAENKLSNDKFINKAPENIVVHEREKLENCKEQLIVVTKNRKALD
ncbi:MAG: valine--tRNA ligase [Candidatus Hatepunaea meridiana]|nr:valine--tRNA ligase [Candidatus Hatepunaea meridiana]